MPKSWSQDQDSWIFSPWAAAATVHDNMAMFSPSWNPHAWNTSQIDGSIQLDHFHKILCNGSKYLICSCCNSQKNISSYDPTVDLSLELSTLYNLRVQDFTSSRFNDIFQASLSLEVSNSYVNPVAQSVHVGFKVKNLFVNICNCHMCIQD